MIKDSKKNTDNIYTSPQHIKKLIQGIKKATKLIKPTYGAAGGNVMIERDIYPFHEITNDCKTMLDSTKLVDPIENMGLNIMKEAADKADKDSKDGRKTTALLTEAIFDETVKLSGELPTKVRKELLACVPFIVDSIDKQKRDITVNDIKSVATTSSESEEIGGLVQDIYKEIGKDCFIEVEPSNLPESFYTVTDGVRFRNARMLGVYSVTDESTNRAIFNKPKVLITREKITSKDQLDPLFKALKANGINELVIACDDIDLSVASSLAITHINGGFKTLLIKAPTLFKDWFFEDLAKVTGATVVNAGSGKTFKNLIMTDLGSCDRVISSNEETHVVGIKDISDHIAKLKEGGLVDDQLLVRVSWLQTKAATLKIGANSETELSPRIKKAKDACAASYLALKDGVVPGGGIALYNAGNDLYTSALGPTMGGLVLSKVLKKPIEAIANNGGIGFIPDLSSNHNEGVDVLTGDRVDMFEAGIIDPAIVIKNAIINAVSIASTVKTIRGIVTLNKTHELPPPRMPGMY